MPIPALLGGLGTALGSGALNFLGARSRTRQDEDLRRQLEALFTPERLSGDATALFNTLRRSPIYGNMRNRAMLGASSLSNSLQSSFARSGLDRSGVAALSMPIAQHSVLGGLNQIDADLFMQALQLAQSNLGARAGIIKGTAGPGVGALTAGGTLESLLPLLYSMMSKQR